MSFLLKGEKEDLLELATELGLEATVDMTKPMLKNLITKSAGYDEEDTKLMYEGIDEERKERELLEERKRRDNLNLEKLRIEAQIGLNQEILMRKFPRPTTLKQVQSFLGLTGYFRKFIPEYSKIVKPLSDLLRKDNSFVFEQPQIEAFGKLKEILTSNPVLHIFKLGKKTELHTDASQQGYGAVLLQEADDGRLHPVNYLSKKTNAAEEKYSSYKLEVLAIVAALKKLRMYLLGHKVKIVTDCSAFQKTMGKRDLVTRIARWAMLLEEFDYEIIHRSGQRMKHVDALSRYPVMVMSDTLNLRLKNAQSEDEGIVTLKELSWGHFSVAKTAEVVKQEFFIPNLNKLAQQVIANCVPCILANRKSDKREGFLNPIPKDETPLHTYHVDFIGPLESTNKNHQHILTAIDAFTKFSWLYPVKTVSADSVLDKLRLQQKTFGNPKRIITDRGSAFTSKDFNDYCAEEEIQHLQITTGVPRGNARELEFTAFSSQC
ncbi:retrovirus-related Pol polyprotein from transposon 17.6 [Trichonephila inaurata madagascariensis]|uniref:RNA-directed DNA polymerase n=1 Tax=Trichonephila inaurata madagascariensis TaxID=2747483 RepID=A0A8X6XTG0_9ARAC|nr:retrovirus-related Pol polyprotein from transposon 17.6 [Trichonephila inaurata madagascariensis]